MGSATPTVLIADDEPQICDMLSIWVEEGGWRCLTAPDGEAALDILRRREVDVALIDLMMLGLDGLEILSQARAEGIKAEMVMISGHGTFPIAVQAIKQGAHDFVEKPFGKAAVVSMLRDLLASRHPSGQNLVTRLDHYVMDHATSPPSGSGMCAIGSGSLPDMSPNCSRRTLVRPSAQGCWLTGSPTQSARWNRPMIRSI